MQKNLYLIIISFFLVSCYTYQVKKVDASTDNKKESKKRAGLANAIPTQAESISTESQNLSVQQTPAPVNVQEKLIPGKNFKIDVDGKSYKIIVDKWESDSLVAHAVSNPKKILKFHKGQINSEKIAEKRFSQPIADIITVLAYAGIGVLIWSIVR
ncbi:hypothetical protein CEY12_20465 [Chryseobacterium sp. T16E-39]|uniref:hypothetical protein n=1 Tax=Chryseobacterium sp. T16E-39 TaxID=2015076 RepID=UPI000B5B20D9|nr:hypothetical protein [Chryseobacterium sp. T16E-39]ASK32312.1 hypothetical protein CEY12_20465 [Chryseobacterium sp. T16E-39]